MKIDVDGIAWAYEFLAQARINSSFTPDNPDYLKFQAWALSDAGGHILRVYSGGGECEFELALAMERGRKVYLAKLAAAGKAGHG